MKYYAAVVDKIGVKAARYYPPYNILMSFHYYKKKGDLLKELLKDGVDIFLDSGAFSAMSLGKTIDINEYCKFIIDNGLVNYASLDVIGDAAATMENYKFMKSEYGLSPIPTFHMGSRIEDLYPLLDCGYIALGGLVFSPGIKSHCDEVWSTILKENPKLKVHGFGLTNIDLMKRYPWYSVDSSSYTSCRRFGRQIILYNGMGFKQFPEDEYKAMLEERGYILEGMDNKTRWFIYDFEAIQSYKMYTAHLTELNKIKSFNYLINQTKLF